MKQTMRNVVIASLLAAALVVASAIYFVIFHNDGAVFSLMTTRFQHKGIEADGWFFVKVFGCKFPVPNRYILRADVSDEFFFITAMGAM